MKPGISELNIGNGSAKPQLQIRDSNSGISSLNPHPSADERASISDATANADDVHGRSVNPLMMHELAKATDIAPVAASMAINNLPQFLVFVLVMVSSLLLANLTWLRQTPS